MSNVEFYFEGQNLIIQCNKSDKMKQVFQSFYSKAGINKNSVSFLYNGEDITNVESTFEQLANIDDKKRNKMNILVANIPNDSSQFIFERIDHGDELMKDFSKMVILLALKEHPNNYDDMSELIVTKFQNQYGGRWSCCFVKIGYGGGAFLAPGSLYYIKIKYGNYMIKIAQTEGK